MIINKYIFDEYTNNEQSIILFIKNFITNTQADEYLNKLNNIPIQEWKEGYVFGRQIPRLQRWYSLSNQYFYSKWNLKFDRWKPQIYEPWLFNLQLHTNYTLQNIHNQMKSFLPNFNPFHINSTQINFYRDNNDMIPQHRDHLETFGYNPSIAILSIGDTRNMNFQRINPNSNKIIPLKTQNELYKNFNIELSHGSMLIMAGNTQKYFSHGIPREINKTKNRFSLTFRNHNPI